MMKMMERERTSSMKTTCKCMSSSLLIHSNSNNSWLVEQQGTKCLPHPMLLMMTMRKKRRRKKIQEIKTTSLMTKMLKNLTNSMMKMMT
jgi:hypothetical protein